MVDPFHFLIPLLFLLSQHTPLKRVYQISVTCRFSGAATRLFHCQEYLYQGIFRRLFLRTLFSS